MLLAKAQQDTNLTTEGMQALLLPNHQAKVFMESLQKDWLEAGERAGFGFSVLPAAVDTTDPVARWSLLA